MDTERATTVDWAFRREVGNAIGYPPHPAYDWGWLDGDKVREYPAWDTDLNVAMELTHGKSFDLIRNSLNGRYRAGLDEWHEWADTPAAAICRTAIAWWNARRNATRTPDGAS